MKPPARPGAFTSVATVFLDRDGVINRKMPEGRYVTRWAEFEFLPGALEGLRRLKAAGRSIIVVTNQRGVARGALTTSDLADIHRRMQDGLEAVGGGVDAIYVCTHEGFDCDCRKPKTGLFRQAQSDRPDIDFARSVVIGDSVGDIEAGRALGCRTILIASRADAGASSAHPQEARADAVVGSLLEAVGLLAP